MTAKLTLGAKGETDEEGHDDAECEVDLAG